MKNTQYDEGRLVPTINRPTKTQLWTIAPVVSTSPNGITTLNSPTILLTLLTKSRHDVRQHATTEVITTVETNGIQITQVTNRG